MKLPTILYISIVSTLLLLLISNVMPRHQINHKNESKRYLNFARLPYCSNDSLKNSNCQVCSLISADGYKVVFSVGEIKDSINFNLVVSANEEGEVVVSFGGPKSTDIKYIQTIYAGGMIAVSQLNNLEIEAAFWNVYSSIFREQLIKILKNLPKIKKLVLVGHSYGGSMALIASYDLKFNQIIDKQVVTFTYTYGALKIGVHNFIATVRTLIPNAVIRIRKKIDFFTILPRCVFIPELLQWHCYRNYVNLIRTYPMFASYYIKFSPIIRNILVKKVPLIVKQADSYLNKPINQVKQNQNNIEKVKSSSKKNTLSAIKKILKDKKLSNHKQSSKNKNHIVQNKPKVKNANNNKIDNNRNNFPRSTKRNSSSDFKPKRSHHKINSITNSGRMKVKSRSHPSTLNKIAFNNSRSNYSQYNRNLSNNHRSKKPLPYNHPKLKNKNKNRRPNKNHPKRVKKLRIRNFLQTDIKIMNKKNIYETCQMHEHYVSCKFLPEFHQVFYGVNIESCQ